MTPLRPHRHLAPWPAHAAWVCLVACLARPPAPASPDRAAPHAAAELQATHAAGEHSAAAAEAPAPPATARFDHFALLVRDVERSLAFYQTVLGLPETYDATREPHIRWVSLGESQQLHLIESREGGAAAPKGIHLALTFPALAPLMARLESLGVPFESWQGEPSRSNGRPDGVRQIYLQDPDGYWIEVNDASHYWPAPTAPEAVRP